MQPHMLIGARNWPRVVAAGLERNVRLPSNPIETLIGPMQRGEYRHLLPDRALDVSGRADVLLEAHRAVPQSNFVAPGMTHHMLVIALNRGAEMHFSWHGAQFERTFRRGDLDQTYERYSGHNGNPMRKSEHVTP
jgi:hypothetical protein